MATLHHTCKLLLTALSLLQISKLLIIPFVCGMEAVWLKRPMTLPVLAAISLVILGVGIV